jgi:ABC-type amino acid transport substrate-binding protein
MQTTRSLTLDGYRFWVVTVAFALFASTFLFPADKTDKTQTPTNTLAGVRQSGTLRLGYYADAGPFSYRDETGKPAGYAISLCQQIANDLKIEMGVPNLDVEFVLVTGTDRFDAITQGRVDLLCGPSVETFARRKEVSFSMPIFPAGLAALVRADAPAQLRDVLSGHEPPYRPLWRASMGLALEHRTFSAVTNTTALNWLTSKRDQFKIDAKIVPVESHDQGVQRVLDRTSDVLFGERSILLDAKKRNPAGNDLVVLDREFTYEPLSFALARGDEDLRLLVDQSLNRLSRSGETQKLYRRFFGEPDEDALTFFRLNTVAD